MNIKSLFRNEYGSLSVDWVVLTAAMIALTITLLHSAQRERAADPLPALAAPVETD